MTHLKACKETLFKWEWIKNNLERKLLGIKEIDKFDDKYPRFCEYRNECPLCEKYLTGHHFNPDCPSCLG